MMNLSLSSLNGAQCLFLPILEEKMNTSTLVCGKSEPEGEMFRI
jgi:hypothetical protein